MRRRDLLWTPAVAALAGCSRKESGALRPLQVGVSNHSGMSSFYLALERGYFRAAGLDAKPQVVIKTSEAVALLAAGRLDAALMAVLPPVFNVISRGADVRIVLGRDSVNPNCGDAGAIYARRSAFPNGTSDPRQWGGKKFWNGFRAGLGEYLLDAMLSSAGLDPKQTPRVELDVTEAVAALSSGAIDAMINSNNLPMNFGVRPGIVREDAGAKVVAGLQITHIVFGSGLVREDPAVGGAFLACCLRGLREFQAGATPQFLRDLVATQGRDAGVITACRDYSTPDGSIDMKSIRSLIEWSVARGYTPAAPPFEKCVDTRFWEIARKVANH